jgi:hypothetical protein
LSLDSLGIDSPRHVRDLCRPRPSGTADQSSSR